MPTALGGPSISLSLPLSVLLSPETPSVHHLTSVWGVSQASWGCHIQLTTTVKYCTSLSLSFIICNWGCWAVFYLTRKVQSWVCQHCSASEVRARQLLRPNGVLRLVPARVLRQSVGSSCSLVGENPPSTHRALGSTPHPLGFNPQDSIVLLLINQQYNPLSILGSEFSSALWLETDTVGRWQAYRESRRFPPTQ